MIQLNLILIKSPSEALYSPGEYSINKYLEEVLEEEI